MTWVEDAHHPRVDMVAAQHPLRRGVPGEPEQVVTFLKGEVQTAGDRGEHLLGRVRSALLLDPAVVVGGHTAQRRDLLAAQPARAPAGAAGKPDVLGLQGLAARAEEVSQLCPVHRRSLLQIHHQEAQTAANST